MRGGQCSFLFHDAAFAAFLIEIGRSNAAVIESVAVLANNEGI